MDFTGQYGQRYRNKKYRNACERLCSKIQCWHARDCHKDIDLASAKTQLCLY